ncbi:hypothetical protein RhiirA1_405610, partial [Rhizophagus irregularis]
DTIAENLAYGQQRRLEIARALASNPKLLLLDEPAAVLNFGEKLAEGTPEEIQNNEAVIEAYLGKEEDEFLGENITGLRADQLLRKGIALVPEGRAILSSMTVLENLEMGAYHRKDKTIKEEIDEVMKRFPILEERQTQMA